VLKSAKKTLHKEQSRLKYLNNHLAKLNKQLQCCLYGDKDNDGHISVACGGDDCDDNNPNVYPGAIEYCNDGIDNNCNGEIDETDLAVDAAGCVASYYGYAPLNGTTLTASATGGSGTYTYNWSTGENSASIDVAPSSSTTYSVTVTDEWGCTATSEVDVRVIDVRCGKKNDKVLVSSSPGKSGKCKEVCIAYSAVKAHLKKGGNLGGCDQGDPCADNSTAYMHLDKNEDDTPLNLGTIKDVSVYPNPVNGELNVILPYSEMPYSVEITDELGRLIYQQNSTDTNIQFDMKQVSEGIYFLKIHGSELDMTKKLIVKH